MSSEASLKVPDGGEPGYLVQIVTLAPPTGSNRSGKLTLQKDSFHGILQEVGDRPVHLLSLAGATESGNKSLLLDTVVSALENLSNNGEMDPVDFVELEPVGLTKTKYEKELEFETRTAAGLWMWSKPFIIRKSDGTELAVLLVDCKGVFEEYTGKWDWAYIIGLSLLTSSSLLYTVFNNIEEGNLTFFDHFMEVAALALTKDNHIPPPAFQKLVFLIQDWNAPQTHPCNLEGGKSYLEEKMKIKPSTHKDNQSVRKNLKSCFKEIECLLMPKCDNSTQENEFHQSAPSKIQQHLKIVKMLTETILTVDKMEPKVIKGQVVLGTQVLPLFEKYVQALGELVLPTTKSVSEEITDARLESFSSECIRIYSEEMENEFQDVDFISTRDLKDVNENYFKEAMDRFCKGSNVTDQRMLIKHCLYLANELRLIFAGFLKKNEFGKDDLIQTMLHEAETNYKGLIQPEVNRMTMLTGELETFLKDCKNKAIRDISKTHGHIRDVTFFEDVLPKLTSHLKDMDDQYILTNNAKLLKIEREYDDVISNLIEDYEIQLTEKQTHTKIEALYIRKFLKSIVFDNPNISGQALQKLKSGMSRINAVYIDDATKVLQEAQEAAVNKAMPIIDEAVEFYSVKMQEFRDSYTGNNIKLRIAEKHDYQKLIASNKLTPVFKICDEKEFDRLKKHLEDKIDLEYESILQQLEDKETNVEERWNKLVQSTVLAYNVTLKKALGGGTILLSEPDVRVKHNETLGKIFKDAKKLSWLDYKKFKGTVTKKIDPDYQAILTSNLMNIEQVELNAKLLINTQVNCLETEMQTKVTNEEYLNILQLQDDHKTFEIRAVQSLREIIHCLPTKNSEALLSNLKNGLEMSFHKVQAEFESQIQMKRAIVSTAVSDYVNAYKDYMKGTINVSNYPNGHQVQQMHENCKEIAEKQLEKALKTFETTFEISEIKGVFYAEVEEEYERTKSIFQKKEADLQQQIEQLHNETLEKHNSEFKLRMACATAIEDLRTIHWNLLTSSIQYFKSQFPTGDMHKMLQEEQALTKQFQNSYDEFVQEFSNLTSTIDKATKQMIQEIMVEYNSGMEVSMCAFAYLPEIQIAANHAQLLNAGMIKLRETDKPASIDPKEYEDILLNQLKDRLQYYQNENISKRLVLQQLILQKVDELKSEFLNELTRNDTVLNILKLRTKYKNMCLTDLEQTYNLPTEDTLKDFSKNAINEALTAAHNHWRTIEPPDVNVRLAIHDSMVLYCRGMEDRTKDKKYKHPDIIAYYHKLVASDVRKSFKESVKQTSNVKQRLEDAMNTAFQKYSDQNDVKCADLAGVAIGIDLGTTCCCASIFRDGNFEMIPDLYNHLNITPSYVLLKTKDEFVVGESAKEQAQVYPQNTIYDVKRLIGRKFDDPITQDDIQKWPFKVINDNNSPMIQVRYEPVEGEEAEVESFSPEEIQARLLGKIKQNAESYLGCKVQNAVITVPAYFSEDQKVATKNAGAVAGLNVLAILNEPTSAAMAHSLNYTDDKPKNLLVYDFGGGTFDVSILTITSGAKDVCKDTEAVGSSTGLEDSTKNDHNVDTKAMGGDGHLGGANIDNNIFDFVVQEFKRIHGIDLLVSGTENQISSRRRRIRHACEKVKKLLSESLSAQVRVPLVWETMDMDIQVTREVFEEMNETLFQQTIQTVETVLTKSNMKKSDIHEVLLVGGSTRIPRVQKLLKDFFNGKILTMASNPDEIVARGAAIYAAIKSGSNVSKELGHIKFSDVTPLSIGMGIEKGEYDVIIKKNTTVPTTKTRNYVTVMDNQTEMDIPIYEGENPVARKNNLLGRFLLRGIPPNKKGKEKVDVSITSDLEGILHVKAVCVSNGIAQDITIESKRFGLTEEAIKLAQKRITDFQVALKTTTK